MTTLLIADKQDVTREGMKAIAARLDLFAAISESDDPKAITRLLETCPDAVVVIDYTLMDLSADQLLIWQERFAAARFVLFSDHLSDDFLRRMVYSNPPASVVMKDSSLGEIEECLRKAARHEPYLCSRTAEMLLRREASVEEPPSPLTPTEREILKLLALGKSTKEIAAARFLSIHTVMTHRKNIFRKLEVNNVHEATRYALRAGLVDLVEYYI